MTFYNEAPRGFGRRGVVETTSRLSAGKASPGTAARSDSGDRRSEPALDRNRLRAREADVDIGLLQHFVGHNLYKYEPTILAMGIKSPDFSKLCRGWSWPAFLFPIPWLAYRKMWVSAVMLYFGTLIALYLLPKANGLHLVWMIYLGMYAKSLYISQAAKKVRSILSVEHDQRTALPAIIAAGGVSSLAAWAAVALQLLPAIAVGVQAAMHAPH